MDEQALGTFVAEYSRIFPSLYVCDTRVAYSPALLVGEITCKHRGHYCVSTHTLLFPNVLDRKPADRVFLTLGRGHGPPLGKGLPTLMHPTLGLDHMPGCRQRRYQDCNVASKGMMRTGHGTHHTRQPVALRRSIERRTGGRLTKPTAILELPVVDATKPNVKPRIGPVKLRGQRCRFPRQLAATGVCSPPAYAAWHVASSSIWAALSAIRWSPGSWCRPRKPSFKLEASLSLS